LSAVVTVVVAVVVVVVARAQKKGFDVGAAVEGCCCCPLILLHLLGPLGRGGIWGETIEQMKEISEHGDAEAVADSKRKR